MTEQTTNEATNTLASTPQHGLDLLDVLLVLARKKKVLLGVPLLAAVFAAIGSLFLDNVYVGTARILPPQQSGSASTAALLAQLGGAGALLGSAVGPRPTDLYAGMLKGQTVADRLIVKFKLKERYDEDTIVQTRRGLEKRTDISAGRDGIISVSVEDTDPKVAAAIANAYAEELQELAQGLALTEAAQRRLFFEQRLAKAQEQLSGAESELRKMQESTGLIQLDAQGKALIEAIGRLRGEITAKEVQIATSKTFATDDNPELVRLRQQLTGLRVELTKLEKGNPGSAALLSTGSVPEAGLEYVRKLRDFKYSEAVMEFLAKQYEIARLDEAKDIAIIQVVDRAAPPDRKTKPYRSVIVITAVLIAGILSLLWILIQEVVLRAKEHPDTGNRFRTLTDLVTRL